MYVVKILVLAGAKEKVCLRLLENKLPAHTAPLLPNGGLK